MKRFAAPVALVVAALCVWLTHPDKTFVFDGVMFAQLVDRSSDEWRRAGNLYGLLALKAETLDAWTKAQAMTGDEALLKRIEELRRLK